MDTKRTVIGVIFAMALFFGWIQLVGYLQRKYPPQPPAQASTTRPTNPSTTRTTTEPATQALASAPSTNSTSGPTMTGGLQVIGSPQASKDVTLGSAVRNHKTFALQLSLASRGAGLQSVTLNDFNRSVREKVPYAYQEPYSDFESASRAFATQSVSVNGASIDLADASWNLEKTDDSSATYSIVLGNAEGPLLQVFKSYEVFTREDPRNKGKGFEVVIRVGLKNLSGKSLSVATSFTGPLAPPAETERGPDQQVVVGYNVGKAIQTTFHGVEEFKGAKAIEDLTRSDKGQPMAWAGTGGVYFDAFVLPQPMPGSATAAAGPAIEKVQAQALNPGNADDHRVVMSFSTNEVKLEPGQESALPLYVYFGPRWRDVLNTPYYAAFPRNYDSTLVMTSGMCGWCTFSWLINLLVMLLTGIHYVFRDWGLAIIGLVILVRVILHPVTKRSQVSMVKMGKMGPEMERLKKKHGDNKEELNKAMVQFYKEQGATPVLGCLPMFLQMPIFIALWACLQSTFELRQSPFLWNLTWIKDLAQPDRLIWFPNHAFKVPFLGAKVDAINLLPILVAVVSYFNQKYTPKPAASTPEQEQQQKMMQWMTLIFPLIFYNMPAGLNIYYLTTTSLGILEGKVIRDHIKQREEAEKAGRIFVPTKATRAGRHRKDDAAPEAPKRGIMGWLSELQSKAEQMRREADGRGKGKA